VRVSERPFEWELRAADGRRMGEGRSPGLHLSDVINNMKACLGETYPDSSGGENFMVWGFIWEMLVPKILARYFGFQRPLRVLQGETKLDGIACTPDAINTDDGYLEEYKATWIGQKRLGPEDQTDEELLENLLNNPDPKTARKFYWWLVQLRANCWVQGTERARLVIAFLSFPPRFRCIEFEFPEQELRENWRMLLREAPAALREMESR